MFVTLWALLAQTLYKTEKKLGQYNLQIQPLLSKAMMVSTDHPNILRPRATIR